MKLEQWHLYVILGAVVLVVTAVFISAAFGFPLQAIFEFAWNALVYLFFVVAYLVSVPLGLGTLLRRFPLEWMDNGFGRRRDERISNGMNWFLGIGAGLLIALLMVIATPYVAFVPSLSVWPIEDVALERGL